jgi:predicted AAA+ superfamily ATPase
LFEEYKTKYWEPKYVIIDEIQDIKNWDFFVRGIFATKKYKIIITGSNSQLLSSEFSTFLTGRYLKFDVLSFSYTEFLAFTKKENSKKSFEEYTRWWGLPEVLLQKNDLLKSHYLSDTISTMLYQDIVKRYKIENEIVAEKILKFLGANLWNLTSLRNIEQQFIQEKMKVGISTISNYVKYFENAYLIRKIDRIWLKGKEFFKFIWKYFFTDIWMRNSLIWIEINYISKILENIIYNELLYRGYDIKIGVFWNKEIDFVVTKWNEKKYIQVCYLLATDDVIDREFWNLLEIKDNYEKIVISFDEIWNFDYKGIRWVNILKWLVEK